MTLDAERPAVGRVKGQERRSAPTIVIDLVFEEAFDELYTRAYGVAYQLLGRRTESEDVAQETLARAFVRWRKIRSYADAWVVKVAANLAIDSWRKNRRLDPAGSDSTEGARGSQPGPSGQRVDLHRALARLSRRQRDVLVLRFLADLPEADVARALGCSVGSVKQHSSRGLATLRATLGGTEENP